MARESSGYIPSSYAGILRYKEELEKDKIVLEPKHIIYIVIAIFALYMLPALIKYVGGAL